MRKLFIIGGLGLLSPLVVIVVVVVMCIMVWIGILQEIGHPNQDS